ncbi:hypothetical protein ABZ922_34860 [Streptomyces shenzhenensis]|uniref:hypothetical protein n=1 Tax=Streptomyces shenzhenensis TaxID=943815 RepID=UPI00340614C9
MQRVALVPLGSPALLRRARVRDVFPVLASLAGLAAEATVCAQLLQTAARGDNLALEDQLRN